MFPARVALDDENLPANQIDEKILSSDHPLHVGRKMTNSLILHQAPVALTWTTNELLHHDCLPQTKMDRLLRNSTQCTSDLASVALVDVYSEEAPQYLGPRCVCLQLRQFVTIFLAARNEQTFSGTPYELIIPPSKVARACKVNMDFENECVFQRETGSEAVVISVPDSLYLP